MRKQITNNVVMVRPVAFGFNQETAVNNLYQKDSNEDKNIVAEKALKEFDAFADKLRKAGVNVNVIQDTLEPYTPDSIFPNNWFSSHEEKVMVLHSMFAKNRRWERMKHFGSLMEFFSDKELKLINLIPYEKENLILEGTGSLVLDRENKVAYCCLSQRADKELFDKFCEIMGYEGVSFNSYQTLKDGSKYPIYHTNVMMAIGEKFAIICSESITDDVEREKVIAALKKGGKEIVDISEAQVNAFAGNALQVEGENERKITVMSETAYNSLTEDQKNIILKSSEILYSDIDTIERLGGGSARCMIGELF